MHTTSHLVPRMIINSRPKINPLLQKAMLNARRPAPSSTLASKEDMLEEADI